eukprot:CAMPEP_0114254394 /NCGR_PEP_ID=MMETSP0058-20121206/16953_1 /TAXON_ID=36894 /ORGANISM="Pyramimonas parkeae, CCMP726" /LENGTH=63 /DNA_ID=CAMNT_0001368605 /DNA_START=1114 /DNA_END=1306 /DNA_ORIENTATION=-
MLTQLRQDGVWSAHAAEFDAIVEEKNALTAKVEEMTAQMAALQEEIEQLKSAQENQEGDAAAE